MTTAELAGGLLENHYSLSATLTRLAGDRDHNFLAETARGERYVCKLMHPDCREDAVQFQCAALDHLRRSSLNLPGVVPASDGRERIPVVVAGKQRILWLLSWCPGTLLADARPHTAPLQESFGGVMAQLSLELADFRHPAMRRGHRWELTRAAEALPLVQHIAPAVRGEALAALEHFATRIAPVLEELPQAVIHNDANDYNVLVEAAGDERGNAGPHSNEARVTGLFDFGDMSWQPVICDAAIALAYLILDQENPLAVCANFLRGYSALRTPREGELIVLLDLIRSRLAVSIAISSHRQLSEPDDPYITISQAPAVAALQKLATIEDAYAGEVFLSACAAAENT